MIFRAIKLCNYGIYANEQVVKPVSGGRGFPNITLIGGENGRGKTSLLDAVLLALYGSRSPSVKEYKKGYSAYLESLLHKGAAPGDPSFVELDMEVPAHKGETKLRVRRSWRFASVRHTDRLEVWRDGVSDPTLAENWDVYVEELLPSGLAGLFFFDGEKIAQLAEADETDDSLRQSIRSLLGLDLVDRLISDLNSVIRRNQAKVRDQTVRSEYDRLQAEGTELEVQLTLKKQEIANLQLRIDREDAKRAEKEQTLYEEGGRLAEARESLRDREKDLASLMGEHKSEATQLAAGALPLVLALPLLQQVAATAQQEEETLAARSALKLLQERDSRFIAYLSNLNDNLAFASQVVTWLDADRGQVKQQAMQPVIFELSVVAQKQLERLLKGDWAQLQSDAQSLQDRSDTTFKELAQVRDHLAIHIHQEDVQGVLKEIAEITRNIGGLKQKHEAADKEKLVIQGQIQAVKQRLSDYGANIGDVEEAERMITYASQSQEVMRTFRERATERKVKELTRQIKAAFDLLTHKVALVSEIRMEPSTLRISLHDATGKEIPKSRLASGEKQMLAISILWGLGRASGRNLPIIIDTPLGRLDSSHRMNFITKYLPSASQQVLVLSTDTEIVGPYLESLEKHIGRSYLLRFDEQRHCTEVEDGYFATTGGVAQ
ncbi:MAG TPA: DNA sulfur modification protein DndD [Symbiobacteriaceae bacterium]|jgi:DNA sulfur modification protein DndD